MCLYQLRSEALLIIDVNNVGTNDSDGVLITAALKAADVVGLIVNLKFMNAAVLFACGCTGFTDLPLTASEKLLDSRECSYFSGFFISFALKSAVPTAPVMIVHTIISTSAFTPTKLMMKGITLLPFISP